jgi:hypothetical protein
VALLEWVTRLLLADSVVLQAYWSLVHGEYYQAAVLMRNYISTDNSCNSTERFINK